jgi:Cd(II)/Pb(II)-responsive transcriptional regulator
MKIGELAQASGSAIETIRFYEREGLLPNAARTASNYRIYDQLHLDRLTFIRHCRSLDMALDEIRVLLRFKDSPDRPCDEVNEVLDLHIGHVAGRIRELKVLEKHLNALRAQCQEARTAGHCGILKGLSRAPADESSAKPRVKGAHGCRHATR